MTSFETHLDEVPTILLCDKDGGPRARLVDGCRPPEPVNVRRPRESVPAIPCVRRRGELENLEDLDRESVSKTLWPTGLGST